MEAMAKRNPERTSRTFSYKAYKASMIFSAVSFSFIADASASESLAT